MIQGKSTGTEQANGPNCVEIPNGWNRILDNGSIVYISPSLSQLRSLDHVIDYLKKDGTCKCGLACPLYVHHVFNFDTRVPSKYQRDHLSVENKVTSCKLCRESSVHVDQASLQGSSKQRPKQGSARTKQPIAGPTAQNAKGTGNSRGKAEANKPKRVNVYRPRKSSSSSLTNIPSPPLQSPNSSPVQNVPTNLGASNQGPLPSFASIISSSKLFNPGPNRGPLQPTTGLPAASALHGQVRPAVSNTAASVSISNQRTFNFGHATSSSIAPSTSTTNRTVTTAVVSQPASSSNVSVGISSQAKVTKGATTVMNSSGVGRHIASAAVSTPVSATQPLVSVQAQNKLTGLVHNPQSMLAPKTIANSALPANSKPGPKPRARPKAKAGQNSRAKPKARVVPQMKPNLAFPNAASQPAGSVSLPAGLQGVNSTIAMSASSCSWPVCTASATDGPNKTATKLSTVVYQSPLTSAVTMTPSSQSVQPSATKSQSHPVAMTTPVWVPLSHLNYQASAKAQTQTQVVTSSSAGAVAFSSPQFQPPVTSNVSNTSTAKTMTGKSVPANSSAATSAPVETSISAARMQAPPGMMYVTAKPAMYPTHFPYIANPAQAQPSVNTSTVTSHSSTPGLQPPTSSQVVSSHAQATQAQNVGVHMPAMYAASQVLPLNVQNFDMSQYKGAAAAYQLQGAMYPGAGLTGNTMAFIAQPTKTSFAGVPTITPASQLNYPNPYMLGIVMPNTNVQQTTASTSTSTASTAPATVMPLAMMQQQNVRNPAVAAAYESFVPIAPASAGSTPRFAQTLAHLASAYNTFTPPGMVPNLQFTYRMMQMSAYANNPHAATVLTPHMPGTADFSVKYPINAVKVSTASEAPKTQAQSKSQASQETASSLTSSPTVTTQDTVAKSCVAMTASSVSASITTPASVHHSSTTSHNLSSTVESEIARTSSQASLPVVHINTGKRQGAFSNEAANKNATPNPSTLNTSQGQALREQQHPKGGVMPNVTLSSRQTAVPSASITSSTPAIMVASSNSQSQTNTIDASQRGHAIADVVIKGQSNSIQHSPPNSLSHPQRSILNQNSQQMTTNTPVGASDTSSLPRGQSVNSSEKKRTLDDPSDAVPETKRTKTGFHQTQYYEANPLLGMKRSCDAIEVYAKPPTDAECNSDDREGYSSSSEDVCDPTIEEEDGNSIDGGKGVTDKTVMPFEKKLEMYNGGANENHTLPRGLSSVNLPIKPQAFPASHYRMDVYGDLSHPRPHFDIGDIVWAQARGLPSWPGQIVDESKVGKSRPDEGKKWVMWFGDHTFSQVEVDRLKTLNEGLRTLDDKARKKKYRAKKTRTGLEQAINEAMAELEMRNRLKLKQGTSHSISSLFSQ